jgi:tRNA1(Val) A37 N6-methylase TrmN6
MFDVVVGNPPYNWSSDTGEYQRRNNRQNLWSRFVVYSWKNLIKKEGFIVMVTPNT